MSERVGQRRYERDETNGRGSGRLGCDWSALIVAGSVTVGLPTPYLPKNECRVPGVVELLYSPRTVVRTFGPPWVVESLGCQAKISARNANRTSASKSTKMSRKPHHATAH
jgi:hypothetical protein